MTLPQSDWLAERFEEHRSHLRAVGYRMLGSLSEAEDAIQETWLRLTRSDPRGIENLGGWLTTVIARVCLDMLKARKVRSDESLRARLPDPIVSSQGGMDPEQEALLADSVGLALLVVLETLPPADRLAFVLHDMFDVPFEEIAPIVGRSATAARQLASRARRRVRGGTPMPDVDLAQQREVVAAFLAAARDNDFEALVAILDPEVVLRTDLGAMRLDARRVVQGARNVAENTLKFWRIAGFARPVVVNGAAGIIAFAPDGSPFSVAAFTVRLGRIVEIDVLADPDRLARLDLSAFEKRGRLDTRVADTDDIDDERVD
jgi:RNA polymerase sigma-70 factor, ECF subfamily